MVLPKYACWLNLIEPWRKQLKGKVGSWQLGGVDVREYVDRYRNQKLALIITPVGRASDPTYTGGICGFVMNGTIIGPSASSFRDDFGAPRAICYNRCPGF